MRDAAREGVQSASGQGPVARGGSIGCGIQERLDPGAHAQAGPALQRSSRGCPVSGPRAGADYGGAQMPEGLQN